jgi:malonyl CoA-acyl carrier protein transacylase
MDDFCLVTVTPAGFPDPSLAIAGSRAGGIGLLDLEYGVHTPAARQALKNLCRYAGNDIGLKLHSQDLKFLQEISPVPDNLKVVILTHPSATLLKKAVDRLHSQNIQIFPECTSIEEAQLAERAGVDGVIAKGHEAGGRIGNETTFILLQRFLKNLSIPLWVQGGIGLHTASACYAAGAAGVVLDSQLLLTRESPLPEGVRTRIVNLDGTETVVLGEELGELYRVSSRLGGAVVKELQETERRLAGKAHLPKTRAAWRQAMAPHVGWSSPERHVLFSGQDIAFAAPLAHRFETVGGILEGIRQAIAANCRAAATHQPLAEGSPLAQSHGTRFPIVQGPMARVSDNADFVFRISRGGALPFVAAAWMRAPELTELLKETRTRLEDRPWGVGLLGFLPWDEYAEQFEVIRQYHPPFALIAGGQPHQVKQLEQEGIATYVHVPSPGLLRMFLSEGLNRFVFEGRESGGHVGPLCSFVLFEEMINILEESLASKKGRREYHVLFAGGIHDAISAAMIAVMSAALVEQGVRVGVQLGTAYLFADAAVDSGAIVKTYQQEALNCNGTTLLVASPGHAERVVETPFTEVFQREKSLQSASGATPEEMRNALDRIKIGRLRVATKGLAINPDHGNNPQAPKFINLSEPEQREQGVYLVGQLAAMREQVCTIDSIHRDISIEGNTRVEKIWRNYAASLANPEAAQPSDIAIIGMACVYPGADNFETYWQNILNKVNAIREIPPERWDWRLYYDPDLNAQDKIYSKWGAFLDELTFDPSKFGLPPNSLPSIEPLQLLVLEITRQALKDAGYARRPFPRHRTSTILGISGTGELGQLYSFRSALPKFFGDGSRDIVSHFREVLPKWTEDSFPGILMNVTAGRIANRFDLGGTNCTVDAACASSLAAVYWAVQELESLSSDMVIVGSADCMQDAFTFMCFAKTQALSPRGYSQPLDESADGIVLGEGLAVVILKRLADAERDGDRIYAVIKSVGASSDGRGKSLTAPRLEGQVKALERAYTKAQVSPATVELIEAHATGTVIGDRTEIESLNHTFQKAGAPARGCAIGSVKSMIGHTKSSAGLASLIKTALALHHKVLPPTMGVDNPNPVLRLPDNPFYVNTETRPWIRRFPEFPRRAGVSAFGFGGTNYHVVLEENIGDYLGPPPQGSFQAWPAELFLWEKPSRQELLEAIRLMEESLFQGAKSSLADLACTHLKEVLKTSAKTGRSGVRLAVVTSSSEDLLAKLGKAREALSSSQATLFDPLGVYFTDQPLGQDGKVAFLFPGQGSQYVNMLSELAVQFPEIRSLVEQSDVILEGKLPRPLSSFIYPPSSFSEQEKQAAKEALAQTRVAQPAMGTMDLAIFNLLQSLGIRPDMVAGHSYGEYVALCAAGVLNEAVLIALSEARARFMEMGAGAHPGAMAAINASAETVMEGLKDLEGVWIANLNAPAQTVITGAREAVQNATDKFGRQGILSRPLPVSGAFHSPFMAPAKEQLQDYLSTLRLQEPGLPVFSNTTARPYPDDPEKIVCQMVEHLVSPVDFVQEINAMYQEGARIFVEVGPGRVLTGLVGQILEGRPHVAVCSNQAGSSGLMQLQHLLGQLSVHGVLLRLDKILKKRALRESDLSTTDQKPGSSPSAWVMAGAKARRLTEMGAATKPAPLQISGLGEKMTRAVVPDREKSKPAPKACRESGSQALTLGGHLPDAAVLSATDGGAAEVTVQHQRLMQRFLETQKNVMTSYFHGARGKTGISIPSGREAPRQRLTSQARPMPGPLSVSPGTPQTQPIEMLADAPAPTPTASAPSGATHPPDQASLNQEELISGLLQIVSQRTGYPLEMLGLDLDLEAELGIDSIKRTEILAHFLQCHCPKGQNGSPQPLESLNQAKTLRDILEHVKNKASLATEALPPGPSELAKAPDLGEADVAASPPASAPSEVNQEELSSGLLQIVSELTGYTLEMLGLDLDLEADLSIDSIKRTEILGYLLKSLFPQGRVGQLAEMKGLSQVKTLQEIVDFVGWHLAGSAKETVIEGPLNPEMAAPSSPVTELYSVLPRFTLKVTEAPLSSKTSPLTTDRVLLVTDDEGGVAQAFTKQLRQQGCKVALVRIGESTAELNQDSYVVKSLSLDKIADLLKEIRERQGPLGGLVHLLPLKKFPSYEDISLANWKECLGFEVKSLFALLKLMGNDLKEAAGNGGAWVLSATGLGGTFASRPGANPRDFFPGHGGVVGLLKTVKVEWPEVKVKAIDLDPGESAATLANRMIAELQADDDLVEVGYEGSRRIRLYLMEDSLITREEAFSTIEKASIILITGGARGITAEVAKELARRYRPNLILAGRAPLPPDQEALATAGLVHPQELKKALIASRQQQSLAVNLGEVEAAYKQLLKEREIRSNLAALRAVGAKVAYFPVDVREEASFGTLIDNLYQTYGRLDGVIHGAGIIEDKLLKDKTWESFDRVFSTKTESAFILSRKLRPDSLKFLVLFSSVAGRFGNRGQGDYTAANEVINKLAVYLDQRWPGRVLAINWGPWDMAGMVTPEVRRQFAERGVGLVSPAAGATIFDLELRRGKKGEVEVVMGDGPWRTKSLPIGPPKSSADLLPLFQGISAPQQNAQGYEIIKRLDPTQDLYLQDHRLDTKPVLPATMAIELMAEAASLVQADWKVSAVRDIRVFRGIILDGESLNLRLLLIPIRGLDKKPETKELSVSITDAQRPERIIYKGAVVLSRQLPLPGPHELPKEADLEAFPLSAEAAYRQLLFHGPRFQCIRSIEGISRNGMIATLAPSAPRNCMAHGGPGHWLLDPIVLDTGPQIAVLWARTYFDITPLPVRINQVRLFKPFENSASIRCHFQMVRANDGQSIVSNVFYVDQEGSLLGIIEGLESVGNKALNRLAGSHLL